MINTREIAKVRRLALGCRYYESGQKAAYAYDAVYNLTSVKDPEDGTYAYEYDDSGRETKLTYPNGWVENYSYDAEGNVTYDT